MALINTTTTGVLGSTFYGDGVGDLTVQKDGVTVNKITAAPAFSATKSSSQSISSSTWTKIQYNAEIYDTANCYDNSTNYRFTPNVAGYYIFIVSINYSSASAPSVSGVGIYKNGSQYRYSPVNYFSGATGSTMQGTYGAYMNGTTDYVESIVYLAATTPVLAADSTQCFFEGYMIRSA